jgi:hypothetical protein
LILQIDDLRLELEARQNQYVNAMQGLLTIHAVEERKHSRTKYLENVQRLGWITHIRYATVPPNDGDKRSSHSNRNFHVKSVMFTA